MFGARCNASTNFKTEYNNERRPAAIGAGKNKMTYLELATKAMQNAKDTAGQETSVLKLPILTFLKQVSKECKDYKSANLFEGLIDCIENGEQSDFADGDFTKDSLCK